MSSKLKIFQYHNVHLYNLKQYRIALEVGVYNSMEGFLSVLGSNQRLAWEFKKWLPILLWIILRAVIIALILYFSWSAIIPNVFPTEAIIYTISPSLCFKIGLLLSIIKKL